VLWNFMKKITEGYTLKIVFDFTRVTPELLHCRIGNQTVKPSRKGNRGSHAERWDSVLEFLKEDKDKFVQGDCLIMSRALGKNVEWGVGC